MPVDERYRRQVERLVRTLPHVALERCFAFFIVYLVSHHRPIERLSAPTRREMREEFERGLAGMMEVPVALDDLVRTREELVAEIVGRMPDARRELRRRSIARGERKWSLPEVRDIGTLPAVESRMRKLAQLDGRERSAMLRPVEAALTDKIDSIHHRARYSVPSVRARASW